MGPTILLAFSGGRDSTFLLEVIERFTQETCHAVFFHTPFVSPSTYQAVQGYLEGRGISHTNLEVNPLQLPQVAENHPRRCYYCKRLLFETLRRRLGDRSREFRIMEGTTLTEVLHEHRPGLQALEELGVECPLRRAGMTEETMEALRAEHGLDEGVDTIGCLATRIPHGIPITRELLRRIDEAEMFLRERKFRTVRARYLGQILKIEVHPDDLERLTQPSLRDACLRYLKGIGFHNIVLDLNGYRTGSIETLRVERSNP